MKTVLLNVVISSLLIAVSLAGPAYGVVSPQNSEEGPAQLEAKRPGFRNMGSQSAPAQKYRDSAILVKFKPGVAEGAKNRLHERHGSKLARKFDRLRLHQLKLKKGMSVEEAVASYRTDPDVEYAEPDYAVSAQANPRDTYYSDQWGMPAISAPSAWNISTGSAGVVVAVIDTGIEYAHPDLAANMWVNPGEIAGNGLDDDGNGFVDDVYGINSFANSGNPNDDHGHGTHVAGTIGAVGNNRLGVTGLNWQVKIMACKFLGAAGSGYDSDAIECLQYVRSMKDRGVPIFATNNSWGGGGYSQALGDAIRDQGDILFVAAAGNSAVNTDLTPFYPAGYQLPNLLSVAAIDSASGLSSFSNYGQRSVHVAAPGSSIISTYLGSDYATLSGTSMAAPHVTGLAALIASQGKDWKQARNLILTGGDLLASLDGRSITEKRINAYGSLTCSERPLLVPLWVPAQLTEGAPVPISALSVNCDNPVGPVTLTTSGGQTVTLSDGGNAPDLAAGDGIFTGTLTPASPGAQALTFTSALGSVTATSPPLLMAVDASADAPARVYYERTVSARVGANFRLRFSATGGLPPYAWSVASGTLPAGLAVDSAAGELSGVPTVSGNYTVTLRVTDSAGMADFRKWTLVVNKGSRAGWPQLLALRVGTGALATSFHPVFADLDHDGRDEVIVADVNTLYVFDANGPVAQTTLPGRVSTPAVANLFKDGNRQIIVGVGSPATALFYAFNKDLTAVPGFPAGSFAGYNGSTGYPGSPVVVDFDGDGNQALLVVTTPANLNDPVLGKNIIAAVDAQGGMLDGWPKTVGTTRMTEDRVVAVGDLDLDGRKEMVFVSNDGILHIYRKDGSEMAQWSVATSPWQAHNPVLADFNGDGFLEIGVGYRSAEESSAAAIYDRAGNLLPGWPRTYTGGPWVGPIAADLDGDGKAELMFPSGAFWNVWQALRADGTSLPGWPVITTYGACIDTYPAVGDLNGDGQQDVLFNTCDGPIPSTLRGYTASGSLLPGFPKYVTSSVEFRTAPALGDLDGNGRVDFAVKSEEGVLHLWESDQTAPLNFQWPMFGYDILHSNAWSLSWADPLTLADFSGSPLSGPAPLIVSFTDASANFPTAWAWDFGDSGTSADRNPTHLYRTPGVYSVSLTVTGATGPSTKTKPGYVTVVACSNGPVRLSSDASHFADFPSAYTVADQDDILQLHADQFSGDLNLNRSIRVRLKGGYDCGYNGNAGASDLLGQLRVSNGTVLLDNLRFR